MFLMGECSIFLKPHSFLLESAFCQRETSESGHCNRIVFKLLSKAVKAYPIHMNPDKKYIYAVSKMSVFVWTWPEWPM